MTATAKPTLKDAFIGKIAGQILNEELKPGDRLPAERELAAKEGISRSAVHLALNELERMGFIETNARHGTYVCDFRKKGNIETLNLLIRLDGADFSSPERMQDMLDMRMAVEGKALELLCAKLSEEDIKALESDIDTSREMVQEKKENRLLAASFFNFHHDICVLSGNFILPMIFNTFEYVTLAYWELAIRQLGREKCIQILEGFLRVIQTKDTDRCQRYLRQEFEIFLIKAEADASLSEKGRRESPEKQD